MQHNIDLAAAHLSQTHTKHMAELEQDLKAYTRVLKRHPDDSNVYYMQALAHVSLANLITVSSPNDSQQLQDHYNAALHSYNQAIEFCPDNLLYIVDRAKLSMKMGDKELAKQDYMLVNSLVADMDAARINFEAENKVTDLYIRNTLQELSYSFNDESVAADAARPSQLQSDTANQAQIIEQAVRPEAAKSISLSPLSSVVSNKVESSSTDVLKSIWLHGVNILKNMQIMINNSFVAQQNLTDTVTIDAKAQQAKIEDASSQINLTAHQPKQLSDNDITEDGSLNLMNLSGSAVLE